MVHNYFEIGKQAINGVCITLILRTTEIAIMKISTEGMLSECGQVAVSLPENINTRNSFKVSRMII